MLAGHFRKMMGQQQAQLNVLARLVVQWPTSRRSWPEAVARPEPLGGTLEEACSAWRHWSYKYELRLASPWDNAASSAEMCESETATTDLAVLQAKSAERGFDALLQVCQAEPKQPAVKLDASSEDHEPNAVHRHNASFEKWEALRCDYAKRPGCSDLWDEPVRVVLLAMASH